MCCRPLRAANRRPPESPRAANRRPPESPRAANRSVLDALTTEHPDLTEVLPRCSFLVNGTATHGDPAEVVVEEGVEVDVLPPFAGG